MKKIAIIVIICLIIAGIGFGLYKLNSTLEKSNNSSAPTKQTEQNTQNSQTSQTTNLNNISNAQILNIANASMTNTNYTFKSVLDKSVSNGQLNVVLLGFMEQNGKYLTRRINASLQDINGSAQIVPGSMQGTNITSEASTTYPGSANIASKENAIERVLQYLNTQGYNVNASDWAIDAFPSQTIGQYTGYLVHVYETFNGNPTSVGWYLVTQDGSIYNAGSSGTGPITSA
ncbi:MAG: hypothetical protein ACRC41_07345 [Sarcina sp.]